MAAAFLLPVLIGTGQFSSKNSSVHPQKNSVLPQEINIYFADEKKTGLINFEEYIIGVLAAEMPASFEKEALKAQAVAARTFAYFKYREFEDNQTALPKQHPDAALCTDPLHCVAYYSYDALLQKHGKEWTDKNYKKIIACVEETEGEIMLYENEPVLAVFHSASAGGKTQSSGEVWQKQLPYLVCADTAGEEQKKDYLTVVKVAHNEFTEKITAEFEKASFSDDVSNWVGEISKTSAGYIKTINIGGITIEGSKIRGIFGLKSTYFNISFDSNNIIFTVCGFGHGVGLSQYGANYMAKCGADYKTILKNYYKGIELKKL